MKTTAIVTLAIFMFIIGYGALHCIMIERVKDNAVEDYRRSAGMISFDDEGPKKTACKWGWDMEADLIETPHGNHKLILNATITKEPCGEPTFTFFVFFFGSDNQILGTRKIVRPCDSPVQLWIPRNTAYILVCGEGKCGKCGSEVLNAALLEIE